MGHGQEPEIRPLKHEIFNKKFKEVVPTIGTILNDGYEDFDTAFIVPDDCVIVVKARPGEISYSSTVFPLLNKIGDPANQELFQHPLSNIKEVVKQLGSVMIYGPGEKCPNYRYTFFAPEDVLHKKHMSHLGLLQTPLLAPLEMKVWTADMNPDTTPVTDYISALYSDSVYPPADLVLEPLLKEHDASMKGAEGRPMVPSDISWIDPSNIQNFLTITQKQLLQIGDDGVAKRPGVYYNFVCRVTQFDHQYYIKSKSGRQIIDPTIHSVIGQNKGTRKVMNRLISEAETRRKPLIRIIYSGGKRTRKNRRR